LDTGHQGNIRIKSSRKQLILNLFIHYTMVLGTTQVETIPLAVYNTAVQESNSSSELLSNCENLFKLLTKEPFLAETHYEFLDNYIKFLSDNNEEILSTINKSGEKEGNLFLFIFDQGIAHQKNWGVYEFFETIVNMCSQLEDSETVNCMMLSPLKDKVSCIISYTNLLSKIHNTHEDLYTLINDYFLNKNLSPKKNDPLEKTNCSEGYLCKFKNMNYKWWIFLFAILAIVIAIYYRFFNDGYSPFFSPKINILE
jgi:hypothetical protein